MRAHGIERRPFGRTRDGDDVTHFTLHGADGLVVELLDYGAIIQAVHVPGRDGEVADVVLGYDDLASYERDPFYLGGVVGRSAGRIGGASFELDGRRYRLAANNGAAHLHGGVRGFGKACWRATPTSGDGPASIVLEHRSADGDEGYPGALDARVTYSIPAPGVLAVDYLATSDKPTVVNLTQHSYWNLSGEGSASVLDHVAEIDGDGYLELGPDMVPTGAITAVQGTPFDFRTPRPIGDRIDADDEQLRIANGYDHTWVLRSGRGELARAARLTDPQSGRTLEVYTTEPALQLYTGNFLDGRPGKRGRSNARRSGLCLETQHHPDAPNHPHFPSTVLRPGETMRSRTEFRFATQP